MRDQNHSTEIIESVRLHPPSESFESGVESGSFGEGDAMKSGQQRVAEADVRAVLESRGGDSALVLVAQPIVDLKRGTVVGYETLARFELASGPASPDRVFAVASAMGRGPELDAIVIERALELAATKPRNCFLTINVDPNHLATDEVGDVIRQHGDLSGIIFELTEHNRAEDLSLVKMCTERLRRSGAMIAIDDAGAGHSGLKQIVELAPQFIKVDRELVAGIDTNESKRVLLQMLGDLADRLDAWVLAEGIETTAELETLAKLGIPLGQGYFLGRPAAPWSTLPEQASTRLSRIARRRPPSLGPAQRAKGLRAPDRTPLVLDLVEQPVICSGDDEWPTQAELAFRVDGLGRPIEMRIVDEHGARVRLEHDLLRVKTKCPIPEITLRATTRSERLRADPIVAIDERGVLEGVVTMHRITSALAHRCVLLDELAQAAPASGEPTSGVIARTTLQTVRTMPAVAAGTRGRLPH